jgi:hypothetical protein
MPNEPTHVSDPASPVRDTAGQEEIRPGIASAFRAVATERWCSTLVFCGA